MNTLEKFTNLCARSRHGGLSLEEHQEKKECLIMLIESGLMYSDNGNHKFTNIEDDKFFTETTENWKPEEEFFFFWETKSPFSQWHPVGFEIDGIHYKTAEHYMMWGKAMLFNDEETAAEILEVKHPRDVKALGRKVKNFDSKVWTEQCQNIVYQGNYAKFTQNTEMRLALRATERMELVEASPYDKIWGIGMKADDPRAQNRETWDGENLLGVVLTSLREKLRFEMKL